ncbi:zinc-binding alcohol dehydrogenase family protein [Salinibacterium sp. PAMC 21357]|uniref:zinc-binding alcohol dehydrogenase family protein n=1 Tax=Salinibacterium sp. PAMC 21357 TaxID=1112215 RepID=UPI00028829F4|nr:zinc-binding alcohol dehydrogenase family protein [Salinibacterium sp. PAMC 21357]
MNTSPSSPFSIGSVAPAVVTRAGGPIEGDRSFVDEELIVEAPTGHDILVEVAAVSVNPVDVKVRAGGDFVDKIIGWDASGVVTAVGPEATLFQPGDEVWYAGDITRSGSYARMQLVDERIVGRKPSRLSHAEAAAMPLTTITAYEALFHKLKLASASTGTLLVLGAAGGVGSILIQLAKELTGVRVIATASRDETRKWVTQMGADAVVSHRGDLAANVAEVAPEGVDWVFTSQTGKNLPAIVELLKPFGEIVAIDDEAGLDLLSLKAKALSWHWELMFTRSAQHTVDMVLQHELLDEVADLMDAGRIHTTLTRTFSPLNAEQLRAAHALVETGSAIGKTVVTSERHSAS